MLITSLDNKKIKDLVKLRNKKYRDLYGKFVVDSVNFIKEADKLGLLLEVYILDGNDLDVSCCKYFVTDKVMNKIKSVNTCLYVGIVNKPVFDGNLGDRILLLDGVCDPGNMGTIIRSALGFNVSSVVLSNTCCDLYNDKCLRACEGSILKVNVLRDDLVPVIKSLKGIIPIYTTDVCDGEDIRNVSNDKFALIIGNEGNGVSNDLVILSDKKINIKTNSNLESLNVGVATSIILYEFSK